MYFHNKELKENLQRKHRKFMTLVVIELQSLCSFFISNFLILIEYISYL